MRYFPGIMLVLGLNLVPAAPNGGPGRSELDGTWVEVVQQPTREEHPAYLAPRAPMTVVIDGHSFLAKSGDRTLRQSLIKPFPDQALKAADLMTVVGNEFWLTRAIYKVEGDTLTIAEGERDGPRPADFTHRKFDGLSTKALTSVCVYKRREK